MERFKPILLKLINIVIVNLKLNQMGDQFSVVIDQ